MSVILANCSGTVHVIPAPGGGGGFFKMDPAIQNSKDGRCLLLGVPLEYVEIVQPMVTLDDRRIIGVFGSAWSEASVAGMLLLGPKSGSGAQLDNLLKWYETNRISKLEDSISASLGSTALEAYVIGLSVGQADPAFNTQPFTVRTLVSKV